MPSYVIYVDRCWNPAVQDQATDQAFRFGQRARSRRRRSRFGKNLDRPAGARLRAVFAVSPNRTGGFAA
jgi:hypothetical protein